MICAYAVRRWIRVCSAAGLMPGVPAGAVSVHPVGDRGERDVQRHRRPGVFLAIRNVAAHEDEVSWTEQEALEHLATLSVIARWIEECTVESAA